MIELQTLNSLENQSEDETMGQADYQDHAEISESEGEDEGQRSEEEHSPNCRIRCTECRSPYAARIHIAFWLLGLCNNFGYVVMLSGAHDILKDEEAAESNATTTGGTVATTGLPVSTSWENSSDSRGCNQLDCNKLSTATILLADILPTLIIKITAPYFMHLIPYSIRVLVCVLCAIASYVLVAFAHVIFLSYTGVVFASIGAGLGEITFLSLTSHYPTTSVSYWSSGTGAAGAVGAWAYLLLRLGLSARDSLLVCNVVPVVMGISFWVLLPKPGSVRSYSPSEALLTDENDPSQYGSDGTEGVAVLPDSEQSQPRKKKRWRRLKPPGASADMTFCEKLALFRPLLKYMIPLFLVYYAEYLINQGLYELMIYRHCISIDPSAQYRWLQALYQFGVFISRSSVQIIPIKHIWVMALLQVVNVGLLFWESYKHIFPSVAISFVFAFYEGLLGGGCYVNAFSRIRKETDPKHCEFSLGIASVADSFGITLAGVSAIPLHNSVCKALDGF